jgi:hypothetical protein
VYPFPARTCYDNYNNYAGIHTNIYVKYNCSITVFYDGYLNCSVCDTLRHRRTEELNSIAIQSVSERGQIQLPGHVVDICAACAVLGVGLRDGLLHLPVVADGLPEGLSLLRIATPPPPPSSLSS